MLPPSLAGKTAAITGATGGIGFAIASRFAREGANVVLAGRSLPKLQEVYGEIERVKPWSALETPQTHSIVQLDARTLPDWKPLVDKHKIDVLVNCAGISQTSLLVRASKDDVNQLIETNLHSAIWGCKTVGRQMISRGSGGSIINVSSLLADRAVVGASVYSATKAGLLGLTTALSQEFGHYGIRVNAIVPGYIDSGMTTRLPDREEIIAKIPLKRFGAPDEIADAAAFLAKNTYANNCILNIDGGLSAV
ncbi:3-oxoacyl-[acyl-carrier-protein] reductase FabG [Madurella mycetomatis]|uniref:3-oxoacyl-[acyl-carrier-protein] reductase FabG n=1 Tax=Madurella mycetomatis TaxID=100816 RepID=A0A175W1G1_9PEZI|nr:3-oxoacyl-[acyl-carrier-protein] reductase FabG [Madurella mycetomatis]